MPYEVSMSGGAPWGFRLAGGPVAGAPCKISRITPGGKAAQANVMQGDVIIAVNGMAISELNLHEIMELVKTSGEQVHLTLLTQDEVDVRLVHKRQSEVNFTTASEAERPASSIPPSPRGHLSPAPATMQSQQFKEKDENGPQRQPVSPLTAVHSEELPCNGSQSVRKQPTPKPRTTLTPCSFTPVDGTGSDAEQSAEKEENAKNHPDYVKRFLKPQKPFPVFKPQVNWLHGKLKINMKPNSNALSDPGNKLKTAAQAHPNQPIEIEGPISATVVHSQYNTPVGLYSGNQIVNALVGTAAAKGANVSDADMLNNSDVDVDKDTPVYKLVHQKSKTSSNPTQSRSIQILDALLSQPEATLPSAF